jgi:hypothetical protein
MRGIEPSRIASEYNVYNAVTPKRLRIGPNEKADPDPADAQLTRSNPRPLDTTSGRCTSSAFQSDTTSDTRDGAVQHAQPKRKTKERF